MTKLGYVYIVTNYNNTTLYVGVTSDLCRRIFQHKEGIIEGFSKRYNLTKLIYFEQGESIESAIEREKFLKGKKRQYKINLIEKSNPKWQDLYEEVCDEV